MLYSAVLLPQGFKSLAAFTETLDLLKFTQAAYFQRPPQLK